MPFKADQPCVRGSEMLKTGHFTSVFLCTAYCMAICRRYIWQAISRRARSGLGSTNPASTVSVHTAERVKCSRSEEHTSELQSLMRISYAVFCLKKKTSTNR